MLLGTDTSGTLYPLIVAAAGLIVIAFALAKLAMHIKRIALDNQPGLLGTGLTLQQLEQMYESGQISRQEFNLLRRRALADVLPPESPANPPAAAADPAAPSQPQNTPPASPPQRANPKGNSPQPGQDPTRPADGGIPDLDAIERTRLRRQREDNSAIRTRKLLVAGLVILAAGLVWLGVFMHHEGNPSGGGAPGAGTEAGLASLPAQSTQPASRNSFSWPPLQPASGPASTTQPPTQPTTAP